MKKKDEKKISSSEAVAPPRTRTERLRQQLEELESPPPRPPPTPPIRQQSEQVSLPRDLPSLRGELSLDLLLDAFDRAVAPIHFGVIYREIHQGNWARARAKKHAWQLVSELFPDLNKKTFEKHKQAASNLERHDVASYAGAVQAIVEGRAFPQLPFASDLAALPAAKRGRSPEEALEHGNEVLARSRRKQTLRTIDDWERYGTTDAKERLVALDKGIDALAALPDLITEILERCSEPRRRQLVDLRLPRLRTEAARLRAALQGLPTGSPPGAKQGR